MRTILIAALIIAAALVILGVIIEAMAWLIVIGLVVFVVALIAGWVGMRRAAGRGHR